MSMFEQSDNLLSEAFLNYVKGIFAEKGVSADIEQIRGILSELPGFMHFLKSAVALNSALTSERLAACSEPEIAREEASADRELIIPQHDESDLQIDSAETEPENSEKEKKLFDQRYIDYKHRYPEIFDDCLFLAYKDPKNLTADEADILFEASTESEPSDADEEDLNENLPPNGIEESQSHNMPADDAEFLPEASAEFEPSDADEEDLNENLPPNGIEESQSHMAADDVEVLLEASAGFEPSYADEEDLNENLPPYGIEESQSHMAADDAEFLPEASAEFEPSDADEEDLNENLPPNGIGESQCYMPADVAEFLPEVPAESEPLEADAEDLNEKLLSNGLEVSQRQRIVELFEEKYEHQGIKKDSVIAFTRFINLYRDTYDESLEHIDPSVLWKFLAAQGRFDESAQKIYPVKSAQLDKVLSDAADHLSVLFYEQNASCVYLEPFITHWSSRFAEINYHDYGIISEELKRYLSGSTVDILYNDRAKCFYIYSLNPNNDFSGLIDISNLLSQKYEPCAFEDIVNEIWYIPAEILSRTCKAQSRAESQKIVNVYKKYVYADHFALNESEFLRIKDFLQQEIEKKAFISDKNLWKWLSENFSFADNWQDVLGESGAYNILKAFLKGDFDFKGPVVSQKGAALNCNLILIDYVKELENITVSEIKTYVESVFDRCLHPLGLSGSIYNYMVRINADEFFNNKYFHFDIEAIDSKLEKLLSGRDYLPFIEIDDLFIYELPETNSEGITWTPYMLQSYLHNYSRSFALVCVEYGFEAKGILGALVRRGGFIDSAKNRFEALLIDSLRDRKTEWHNEAEARQLLVKLGYQKTPIYKDIDNILRKIDLSGAS